MPSRKTKSYDLGFAILLLAAAALLIWKAPFGMAFEDESFYLSVPYRMVQGDILLADEWNMSQMTGILLYPAMRLFCALSPSTEGINLVFRYIYLAAQMAVSIYIYVRLQRLSPAAAIPAALVFMLYTPFNLMTLSYNSMGLMLLSSSCVTLATSRRRLPDALVAGLMFAGSVLCCPYLLIVYFIYCLCTLLCLFLKPVSRLKAEDVFTPAYWLCFTLGAALLALALILPLLIHGRVNDAIASLPEIMNGDGGGHHLGDSWEKVPQYFLVLAKACPLAVPVYLGCLVLLAVILLGKNAMKRRGLYMLFALLLTGVYYCYFIFSSRYVNFLMFPLCFSGLFAYLLCRERDRRLFRLLFIPGVLYSFCIHLSSNQYYYNISSAMTISCFVSVFFMARLALELKEESAAEHRRLPQVAALVIALALLMQLGLQSLFRAYYCFWDGHPSQLSYVIDRGPGKDLRTTEDQASVEYYSVLDDAASVREAGFQRVLYYSRCTWLYLADDARSASFSAWLSQGNEDMLLRYWEHYPDKKPQCIYILKSFAENDTVEKLNLGGMELTETELAYILTIAP